MNKLEVLGFSKEARGNGYITNDKLLDLFKDDEQVPDTWISFMIYKPKPCISMIVGESLFKIGRAHV